ncbi:MAG TPA: ADOP family duplicated permease [Gemmatimonadaceae bacterium]|jgi:predicted permease
MFDTTRRDLSYATRSLRRSPAFALTVIVILGIAIGMSSAMFTVFQSVLLKRLPVQQQSRIVELSGIATGAASEIPISPAQIRRFQEHSQTVQSAASLAHWRVIEESLLDGDRRITLNESVVGDAFFTVLGANPSVGRLFRKGDAVGWGSSGGGTGVPIVLSHAAWKRAFNSDSSVIGRTIRSPKMSWTMNIVGVAAPGLDYPRGVEFWVAADYNSDDVVARLAPNATPEAARREFESFLAHDPDQLRYMAANTIGGQVHTIDEMITGDARPALLALSAAVALLLVLACINVGNLSLLRASGRTREMPVRRALGASAMNLVRQLLTESVLLAVVGGALGVLLARVFLATLIRIAPAGLPRVDLISLAGTPMLAGLLVTGLAVLLFGVVPAFASMRFDLSSPLRADSRSGTEGRRLRRVRQGLVASQLALAVVVLAGAGLLGRSLMRLTSLDMGYSTEHLSMLNVSLPWHQFVDDCKPANGSPSPADSLAWSRCYDEKNFTTHERVMANLRAIAGVVAVSPEGVPPFLGSNVWMGRFASIQQSDADAQGNPWFGYDAVGPEYFKALGVPIAQGRAFTDADRIDGPRVAIITESVAKRLWPTEPAVGKRLREAEEHSPDSLITVVGVIKDFHYRQHRTTTPTVFRPYRQAIAQGYLIVRTRGSAIPGDAIRRAVESAGNGATFIRNQAMDDLIAPQLATPRFDALLLAVFAVAAIVLAAVGLYGIIASAVRQQTREIGIRMALGATTSGVRNMVLSQALGIAAIGAVVGLIGAIAGARLLTSLLFDVRPTDPMTLVGVTALLLVVAALAAYLPARRATAIDPARALRAE